MPAPSQASQRLFQAAEHGADFPMARKVRSSMSASDLHDFASGSMAGKPEHVRSGTSTAAHSLRHLKSRIKHGK
jgi:hypothetical protein